MSEAVILLCVDGLEIPVTVTRKRVKNLNLRVRADGSVTLSIPPQTTAEAARGFLERKAAWIAERVHRARERQIDRGTGAETSDGAPGCIPLWGELVPLDIALPCQGDARLGGEPAVEHVGREDATGTMYATGDVEAGARMRLSRRPGSECQDAIDELYRAEVRKALPAIAERMERRIGVQASRWSVRAMKTRWGSCTPKTAAIRINARLAAYPPECLEFVVAHELVHLLEPSHNARFYKLLDEFCPNHRQLASMLKDRSPVATEA